MGGIEIRYLDMAGICRAFKVSQGTIYTWIGAGIMPEPFYKTITFVRKTSNIWTTGQILAVATVLNHIYKEGVVNINIEKNAEILKYIKKGAALAVDKLKRRIAREYKKRVNEDIVDVEWL